MEKQMQTQTIIQFPTYMHKLLTVFVSHLQVVASLFTIQYKFIYVWIPSKAYMNNITYE